MLFVSSIFISSPTETSENIKIVFFDILSFPDIWILLITSANTVELKKNKKIVKILNIKFYILYTILLILEWTILFKLIISFTFLGFFDFNFLNSL